MTDKYTAPNQELFSYLSGNFGLNLVQSELNDIINIVLKTVELKDEKHEDCIIQSEPESLQGVGQ